MSTENFNLPLITDNMANDVVRDMNALAEAIDGALKVLSGSKANNADLTAIDSKLIQHLGETGQWVNVTGGDQVIPNATTQNLNFDTLIKYKNASFVGIVNNRVLLNKGIYLTFLTVPYFANTNGVRVASLPGASQSTVGGSSPTTVSIITIPTILTITTDNTSLLATTYQDSGNALSTGSISLKILKVGDLS